MIKDYYPRPQLEREQWQNLNGKWLFAFDDHNIGIKDRWYEDASKYDQTIQVPFVYQCRLSGIEDRSVHNIVWYYREFEVDVAKEKSVILHFGAVDYEVDVFVNGQHICHHVGGNTPFEADITYFLNESGSQTISVRAFDCHTDESIPRGKQSWEPEPRSIWYTNSTGIWQTVWIETVEKHHIESLRFTPQFDEGKVLIEAVISEWKENMYLSYDIRFQKESVAAGRLAVVDSKLVFSVDLFQEHIFRGNFHHDGWCWTPENPNLFDVKFVLEEETRVLDQVNSYFGMRKIHMQNGMVYLNNKPYYQKLVLDQGYWPDGLLTAPSEDDFIKDIKLAKDMGFNGCRKHQKMEDPRFLYWADKLGFLVWGECASTAVYNNDAAERLMREWSEIICRDYNHPCIVIWVPMNESWGAPNLAFDRQQQHFSQTLYHYIHALDTTRLVISNDGWSATETDIVAVHNYTHGEKDEKIQYEYFKDSLSSREKLLEKNATLWPVFAEGFQYENQPIILTEFGGIGFDVSENSGWGYTSARTEKEFTDEYRRVVNAVLSSKGLWGFCYTQITDVEQEINGLLTYDRKPKCDVEIIRKINEGYHVPKVE